MMWENIKRYADIIIGSYEMWEEKKESEEKLQNHLLYGWQSGNK